MTTNHAAIVLALVVSVLIWLRSRPAYNPLAQLAHLFIALNAVVTNTIVLLPRIYRMWLRSYPATRRRVHRDLLSAPDSRSMNQNPCTCQWRLSTSAYGVSGGGFIKEASADCPLHGRLCEAQ